jgi:hypothetical protein
MVKNFKFNYGLEQFYSVGIILFSIVALASIYTIYHNWDYSDMGSKVSGIASVLFDCALVGLFVHFRLEERDKLSDDGIRRLLG